MEEHRLFQQKAHEIKQTLWETQYQLLRNEELLKARERLLDVTVEKAQVLTESSEGLKNSAQRLLDVVN